MNPITVPYTLELTKDEDAKDATAGTTLGIVAGKMQIGLNTGADVSRLQACIGSLRSGYRRLITDAKANQSGAAITARGNWADAVAGNITVASTLAATTGDVTITIAGDFAGEGATHFIDETFDQLINKLRENSAGT